MRKSKEGNKAKYMELMKHSDPEAYREWLKKEERKRIEVNRSKLTFETFNRILRSRDPAGVRCKFASVTSLVIVFVWDIYLALYV